MVSYEMVRQWGRELESHVAVDGMTVAIFLIDDREDYAPLEKGFHTRLSFSGEDYWVTAVMTRDWEDDKTRRFWAFNSWEQAEKSTSGVHWLGSTTQATIHKHVRGLTREGPIEKLLWVKIDRKGRLEILPHVARVAPVPRPRQLKKVDSSSQMN